MKVYLSTSLDAGGFRREAGPGGVLRSVLEVALPLGNPDFEAKYDSIVRWLLEVDEESGLVLREVGLDELAVPIAMAPLRDNIGFWTRSEEPLEWQGMLRIRGSVFEAAWERCRRVSARSNER